MKLGEPVEQENHLLGRRDAFHVACVLCAWSEDHWPAVDPQAGALVRFTGDAFSEVRPIKEGETPHGVVDPFLTCSPSTDDQMFWVLLMPGLASAPQHHFDLNIDLDPEMLKGQWDCRNCED